MVQSAVLSYSMTLDTWHLSVAFPVSCLCNEERYYAILADGRNHVGRFAECSVIYAVIIIVLCTQKSVTDLWIITSSASNMLVSMWLLLLSDSLLDYHGDELLVADENKLQYSQCAFLTALVSLAVAMWCFFFNIITYQKFFISASSSGQTNLGAYIAYIQNVFIGLIYMIQADAKARRGCAEHRGRKEEAATGSGQDLVQGGADAFGVGSGVADRVRDLDLLHQPVFHQFISKSDSPAGTAGTPLCIGQSCARH